MPRGVVSISLALDPRLDQARNALEFVETSTTGTFAPIYLLVERTHIAQQEKVPPGEEDVVDRRGRPRVGEEQVRDYVAHE